MRHVLFAAVAVILLGAPPVGAQPAPSADALFKQGRAALDAGKLEVACEKFRESSRIEPHPVVIGNLGICEEKRGHLAAAWATYHVALKLLPAGDARAAPLREQIASLDARLPRLVMTLAPDAPAGTTVREGETEIGAAGSFGATLPLDPGVHHLVVAAPGRAARAVDVELTEGKTAALVVVAGVPEAGPLAVVPPGAEAAVPPAPPGEEEGRSPGPWVIGGIGIIGLVTGTVTGVLVLEDRSAATLGCNLSTRTCTSAGLSAAHAGSTLGPVTTIALVTGAAGVLAGGLWLGLRAPSKAHVAVGVGPVVGGAAWRVGGSW